MKQRLVTITDIDMVIAAIEPPFDFDENYRQEVVNDRVRAALQHFIGQPFNKAVRSAMSKALDMAIDAAIDEMSDE